MNIFILSTNPVLAAIQQCNAHILKMPVESAQMLSTAHRILDGTKTIGKSKTGRKTTYFEHPDNILYKCIHMHHPCTVWTMESSENYRWHYQHWIALCREFEHRYGKVHKSFSLLSERLSVLPKNIPAGPMTPFALAMGTHEHLKDHSDPVKSYREFYKTKRERFVMKWTNRSTPEWFSNEVFS
jgi:hypothetical protein